ncbi:MAG: amidohydrolase family protein [Moorella humiferrea]|uniref:N-isopropylammelide isopropyl amidohydrolase n=1 Tax=Neomoorella humiferrea TaxID=676965 RepID=A0A2T0AQM8_9FIRM|nr:amidohydrolase family protein [Moorella humiferrea]MBE3572428.1 amidohydrolase family protein [Moorella humiferrea]PRR71230.1 N-isopropylammelide isopropyl amidohydrolase [Moorella humiferrea]
MNDLLIRRARLMDEPGTVDVAIKDGYIVAAGGGVAGSARQMIDAAGRLLIPAFVDAHTHLDKALTASREGVASLAEAIEDFQRRSRKMEKNDFLDRGRRVLKMALSHGTTAMRAHITVSEALGLRGIEAALELKREFAGKVELQVFAMAGEGEPVPASPLQELLEEALRLGADGLGGAPYLSEGMREWVDYIFALAGKYNVPIDLHVDETDAPTVASLEYIAAKTVQTGYQGRVVASHCCGLAAVDDARAAQAIAAVKDAGISVITLPSCELYLMGRQDRGLVRRGVTRVGELQAAGVNVAYASGNIRDAFRPFGNADMLEEALITAQVLQMGTPLELKKVLEMGTYNAAAAIGLNDYGIKAGGRADLVLLDASSPAEAIIGQVEKVCVIKGGRVAARNDKKSDIII